MESSLLIVVACSLSVFWIVRGSVLNREKQRLQIVIESLRRRLSKEKEYSSEKVQEVNIQIQNQTFLKKENAELKKENTDLLNVISDLQDLLAKKPSKPSSKNKKK